MICVPAWTVWVVLGVIVWFGAPPAVFALSAWFEQRRSKRRRP